MSEDRHKIGPHRHGFNGTAIDASAGRGDVMHDHSRVTANRPDDRSPERPEIKRPVRELSGYDG